MGNYAINRQRIGIPRGELLAVFQLFTENLPDGVRFREAMAIKTWKRLELQRYSIDIINFVLLPLFTSQQYIVKVPSMHISGSLLGAQV